MPQTNQHLDVCTAPQTQSELLFLIGKDNYVVTEDGFAMASRTTIRNLGFIFDHQGMTHRKQTSTKAFLHLRNIAEIRHLQSLKDADKLHHAFVTSTLDYCNFLRSVLPKKVPEDW